jgi:hypothetical protein
MDRVIPRDVPEALAYPRNRCAGRVGKYVSQVAHAARRDDFRCAPDLAIGENHPAAKYGEQHGGHEQRKLPLEGHSLHPREVG